MTTRPTEDMKWFEKGWEAREHSFPITLADDPSNVPSRYREDWREGWTASDETFLMAESTKFHDLSGLGYTVTDENGGIVG